MARQPTKQRELSFRPWEDTPFAKLIAYGEEEFERALDGLGFGLFTPKTLNAFDAHKLNTTWNEIRKAKGKNFVIPELAILSPNGQEVISRYSAAPFELACKLGYIGRKTDADKEWGKALQVKYYGNGLPDRNGSVHWLYNHVFNLDEARSGLSEYANSRTDYSFYEIVSLLARSSSVPSDYKKHLSRLIPEALRDGAPEIQVISDTLRLLPLIASANNSTINELNEWFNAEEMLDAKNGITGYINSFCRNYKFDPEIKRTVSPISYDKFVLGYMCLISTPDFDANKIRTAPGFNAALSLLARELLDYRLRTFADKLKHELELTDELLASTLGVGFSIGSASSDGAIKVRAGDINKFIVPDNSIPKHVVRLIEVNLQLACVDASLVSQSKNNVEIELKNKLQQLHSKHSSTQGQWINWCEYFFLVLNAYVISNPNEHFKVRIRNGNDKTRWGLIRFFTDFDNKKKNPDCFVERYKELWHGMSFHIPADPKKDPGEKGVLPVVERNILPKHLLFDRNNKPTHVHNGRAESDEDHNVEEFVTQVWKWFLSSPFNPNRMEN